MVPSVQDGNVHCESVALDEHLNAPNVDDDAPNGDPNDGPNDGPNDDPNDDRNDDVDSGRLHSW